MMEKEAGRRLTLTCQRRDGSPGVAPTTCWLDPKLADFNFRHQRDGGHEPSCPAQGIICRPAILLPADAEK